MPKQVKDVVVVEQNAPVTASQTPQKNLYITVNTYDQKGDKVATRVVDMYHYGTTNWLQNHTWWAMHNSHMIGTMTSSEDEINDYLDGIKAQLANKFNKAA
jgi:hypothetical protein